MGRTLHFQQIVDSRLEEEGTDLKALLLQWVQDTTEALGRLPSVVVQTGQPLFYTFPPESRDPNPTTQWRVDFYVRKDRRTTWDQVYETVNQVKSAHYSFLK